MGTVSWQPAPSGRMPQTAPRECLECDLCIVGAGYAGLNALNAAAKYMAPGERVVFVDKNRTWGGQWVGQYDYLRLHQPYRMFTAGDQKWRLRRAPSYLATRQEVLDHLSSVPGVSAGHLSVDARFRYAYARHRVRQGKVEIEADPVEEAGEDRKPLRIVAARMLNATGAQIEVLKPFALSSARVRSVAVADPIVMSPEFLDDDKPVYIIGSGKTAMDTALHVIEHDQRRHDGRRRIHVITGQGMWFFSRDRLYPRGLARHRDGVLVGDFFLRMAELFEGANEEETLQQLAHEGVTTSLFPDPRNFRFGILSLEEIEKLQEGLDAAIPGYLVDVEGTTMRLRQGNTMREVSVPEGSWFLNCTTHIREHGFGPVLRDSGLVCAPQYAMGFTGTSAYYITHAWYRGELARVAGQLFRVRVDIEPSLRFAPMFGLMVMANTALVTQRLPLSIVARFQGDFNKWYPLHRQVPMFARVLSSRRWLVEKAERLIRERFSDSPPRSDHEGVASNA